MKITVSIFSKLLLVLLLLTNTASAGIIIDSPNDVIYAGTFNGSNIFAGLINVSSLTVHSNIDVSGTVDGRDISADGLVLDDHISDVSNPHSVTKEQVGLGNVTDDTQLKASQLEMTLTNDDAKVPSSSAVAAAITAALEINYSVTIGTITSTASTITIPEGSGNKMYCAWIGHAPQTDGYSSYVYVTRNGVRCTGTHGFQVDQYVRSVNIPLMFYAEEGDVIGVVHSGSGIFSSMKLYG